MGWAILIAISVFGILISAQDEPSVPSLHTYQEMNWFKKTRPCAMMGPGTSSQLQNGDWGPPRADEA